MEVRFPRRQSVAPRLASCASDPRGAPATGGATSSDLAYSARLGDTAGWSLRWNEPPRIFRVTAFNWTGPKLFDGGAPMRESSADDAWTALIR